MATLTVWRFDTYDGADQAEAILERLAQQELITIQDAAIVSWPATRKSPRTRQLRSVTGAGALGGAFWGLLFGLLFFMPFLGMAVGAARVPSVAPSQMSGSTTTSSRPCVHGSNPAPPPCSQ